MHRIFVLTIIGSLLISLSAYDFRSRSGKLYKGAGIGKISSSGIELILPSGIEVLPLEEVPDELVNKLSPARRKRFQNALAKRRAVPAEIREMERKKAESRGRLVAEGWKMHRNLELWLRAFSVAKSPGEDACLFASMARSFRREFQSAETDAERADIFAAFLKKVKKSGLSGEIKLDIPKPSAPQHQGLRGNYPLNPPHGSRYYKVNGRRVPVNGKTVPIRRTK